jgi:hypothetical protein
VSSITVNIGLQFTEYSTLPLRMKMPPLIFIVSAAA